MTIAEVVAILRKMSINHDETQVLEAINGNILAEMARARCKRSQLAEVLGMSPITLGARLKGRVSWSVVELYAIAAYFGKHPWVILNVPAVADAAEA